MKKTIAILSGLLLSLTALFAQKTGYVNTETILSNIPEYTSAQSTLETLSKQYMTLIENESAKVDAAYKAYQSDRPRLTESEKQIRERDIVALERSVKEKQKVYFGEDGIMSKKSEELLSPIKAKVEAAIAQVAINGGYDIIIDLKSIQGVVYNNPTSDLSPLVIKELK